MLTSDKEVNRDFDINNLFLNLDFQHQEETFEYKWPLLDHPSNYQLIVTKLLTRTSLPYIKLHENKTNKKSLGQVSFNKKDKIYFDYLIKMKYHVKEKEKTIPYETTMRIHTYDNIEATFEKKCFPFLTDDPQKINNEDIKEKYLNISGKQIFLDDMKQTWVWYDVGEHRNIYSLDRVFHMINNTLYELVKTMCFDYGEEVSNYFKINKIHLFREINYNIIYFRLEDNVPCLYVAEDLLSCLEFEAVNIDQPNINSRRIYLYFSKNLAKFLKGFHFIPCLEYEGEFVKFYISHFEKVNAAGVTFTKTIKKYDDETKTQQVNVAFRIFKGEKLNIMELSDYIGLAITSPDFPIKEQIYPQYFYDFGSKLFEDNRRHYTPASEFFIGDITDGLKKWHFEKENVSELTKYSTGDKILFVKYFDPKTEDMNAISYENNNSSTTLKMDLMNVMPLKKFTLKLYLIDRYNNFEPLYPRIEGYDDVIKLQLLFTRIKGDEKENRNFIETKLEKPERVTLNLVEEEEEEEEEENEPEIQNEPENNNEPEIINEPEIPNEPVIIQVPAIEPELQENEEEENEEEEEDLEPPPEKIMYIDNEEGEENSENELY